MWLRCKEGKGFGIGRRCKQRTKGTKPTERLTTLCKQDIGVSALVCRCASDWVIFGVHTAMRSKAEAAPLLSHCSLALIPTGTRANQPCRRDASPYSGHQDVHQSSMAGKENVAVPRFGARALRLHRVMASAGSWMRKWTGGWPARVLGSSYSSTVWTILYISALPLECMVG